MFSIVVSFLVGAALGMGLFTTVVKEVVPIPKDTALGMYLSDTKELDSNESTDTHGQDQMNVSTEVLAASEEEIPIDEEALENISETPLPTITPEPITFTSTPTITPTVTLIQTGVVTVTQTTSVTSTPTAEAMLTVTPTPTSSPTPQVSSLNTFELINIYAGQYGVDSGMLRKIADCESHFNTNAVGPKGLYVGMFQFGVGSWQSVRNLMKLDPNPDLRKVSEESIKTAAYALSLGKASMWPNCAN